MIERRDQERKKHMIYLDSIIQQSALRKQWKRCFLFRRKNMVMRAAFMLLDHESRKAVSNARRIIAESLNCTPQEIYFTTGGSEADNWALIATSK